MKCNKATYVSIKQEALLQYYNLKMEDNHIFLMRVLKIHYKDRMQILDEALKVIKEYSNKPSSSQNEYDITSLTLQSMLSDLPVDILKYFLTMVPLPKNKENSVRNKDDNVNIRAVLLKYLNEEIPPLVPLSKPENRTVVLVTPANKDKPKAAVALCKDAKFKHTNSSSLKQRTNVRAKRRGPTRAPIECRKLLDLCAEYVVHNQAALRQDYHTMKEKVWKMVNSNKFDGETLESLYAVIRDLNKKIKWMRLLDSDEVPEELIRDEYGCSNVFVKERNLDQALQDDPFEIKGELNDAIARFIKNNI